MVFQKKTNYGHKKRMYRNTSYRKRSPIPAASRPEIKRRFVKVFDATVPAASYALTNNLSTSRILSNIVTGGNDGSVIGSKIFIKGIRIKAQVSADATAEATLGEFSVCRLFLYTASSGALATRATPAITDVLVNDNADDSNISAMVDSRKVKMYLDKRMYLSTTRCVQYIDKYIKVNKVHTFAESNADISSSTLGRYLDWYVSFIGGGSSGVATGPYVNLEVMIYYTDV